MGGGGSSSKEKKAEPKVVGEAETIKKNEL